MSDKLTDHQQKVFDAFDVQDMDISIKLLYIRVYGKEDGLSSRGMQQKLAPTFAAINDKLEGKAIKPGLHKRTYRITKKD